MLDRDPKYQNYVVPYSTHVAQVEDQLKKALADAETLGIVVTIEQTPGSPLAMGNYTTIINMRGARIKEDE